MEVISLDESIKSASLPADDSEQSSSNQSQMDVSGLGCSELDVSHTSLNTSSNTTPKVKRKVTPKESNPSASKLAERERKRLEKLKEKEVCIPKMFAY